MSTLKWIALAFIIMLISGNLQSQDAPFSQYDFVPIFLNPAQTGIFTDGIKAQLAYRNQWQSELGDASYRIFNAFMDTKIDFSDKSKLGIGGSFYRDQAGSVRLVNRKFSLSSSFSFCFMRNEKSESQLAFGFDLGQGIKTTDYKGIQDTISGKKRFFDLSMGMLWHHKTSSKLEVLIGMAVIHVNEPNASFYDNVSNIYPKRVNAHASILFPLMSYWRAGPEVVYSERYQNDQTIFRMKNQFYYGKGTSHFAIGLFSKAFLFFEERREFHTYGIDALWRHKSILIGGTVERNTIVESNSYEFSVGYVLI